MQPEINAGTGTGPVRWGVLGTGKIGVNAVIPAIEAANNAQFVAIASRDLANAERISGGNLAVRAHSSYEALLDDPEVEAVYIPLPNGLHLEWTVRAAEHGKHVLCEKPLGATADEARRMRDACKAAGVLLMEAFMYRFHPQIRWALDQLAADVIGPVRLVRSAFAFDIRSRPNDIRLQAELAGGSLMDVGCYPLNFSRAVFGEAPRAVAARVDVPAGSEVERTAGAVLDYGEGRMAMIDCSFAQPRHQFAEVVGERGRLVLPRPFTTGGAETVVRIEREDETVEHRIAPVDHYQLEVEHFSECVRSGQQPYLSLDDAIEQAEAIEAIYRAADYKWPW